MNKINKADYSEIQSNHNSLEKNRESYNHLAAQLHEELQTVIDAFSEKHADQLQRLEEEIALSTDRVQELVTIQTKKMEDYECQRSDAWHDGQSGEVFRNWLESWEDYVRELDYRVDFGIFERQIPVTSEPITLPPAIKPKELK